MTKRAAAQLWRFANAEFDEAKRRLHVGGEVLPIESRPLGILLCLLRNAGQAVSKDDLIAAAWGHTFVSDGALTNAIGKLRRALDDEEQKIIATVYGIGYRLEGEVKCAPCVPFAPSPSPFRAGDRVPSRTAWRLLKLIGNGMSTEVWLAEENSTGERRAFKLSPDGAQLPTLKREAALLRLLNEALGGREDIIQLRDWNFDELPFFIACQYGGLAIHEWADQQGGLTSIPLALRLELTAKIADAVAAAHSIGILHKDLKPGNVLIEGDQQNWKLRLTDFGSGQLTDSIDLSTLGVANIGLTQARMLTEDDHTGTHLYVAPELMTGNPPTVQSDIFSLGVIVYQIAVGDFRRPLAPGWEREIGDELLRMDIADAANGNPQHRIASAKLLSDRLRALESRRAELAARREAEQMAKANAAALIRARSRWRWLIAAVGALVIGLLISLYDYRLALIARDEAREQSAITAAINDFMNHDLLGSANPANPGGKDMTVHEAARLAAAKADSRFADRPEIDSALHRSLGNLFSQMSDSAGAAAEYGKALIAYKAMHAANPIDQATVEISLASAQARLSHFDDAKRAIADAETLIARLPATPTALQQQLLASKAAIATYSLDCATAIKLLESAITVGTSADADRKLLRTARGDLANCYCSMGRIQEAEVIYQKLIADSTTEEGWNAPRTVYLRVMSLQNQVFLGKAAEVEPELIEAHHQLASSVGPDHRWTIWAESALAESYAHQGKWQQMKDTEAGIDARLKRLGTDRTTTGYYAMARKGVAEYQLGEYKDALQDLQAAQDGLHDLSKSDSSLSQYCAYFLALTALDSHLGNNAASLLAPISAEKLKETDPAEDWAGRLALARGRAAAATGQTAAAREQFQLAASDFSAHQPDDADLLAQTNRQIAALH